MTRQPSRRVGGHARPASTSRLCIGSATSERSSRTRAGTSQQGFEAEWRGINVLTVEGDRINRGEIFDEADLDAALARFDELQPQARRVENAATQVTERFLAQFAAGDWDAMPKMMADNFSSDDRRRVVGAGVRHGRNAQIMDMRAIADLGITNSNTTHLATRGKRLALSRIRMSSKDQPFYGEMLDVLEINADAQIVKYVVFDPDDVDAAFEELDARYLAGEAADHAHTWALIARLYAGLNRHELPPTTPDFVDVDNRRLAAFAPGDIREFARTAFDQVPDLSFRIEAVHRLSNLGAVVTQALRGTSREGFEAEWCEIHLVMIEGDLFNRSEIFDEADLDAALARFDELHPQAPRLANAASQVVERFWKYFDGPRLGRDGRDNGRRLLHARSPSGCKRRCLTRSCCPYLQHASSGRRGRALLRLSSRPAGSALRFRSTSRSRAAAR